jgi:hypothetical protein
MAIDVFDLNDRITNTGGYTVRVGTVQGQLTISDGPETGYAVSVNPEHNRQYPAQDCNAGTIARWLVDYSLALSSPDKYAGAWLDDETGTVHLDVITIVDDLTKALDLAHEYRERAVWDLARGEEIRTAVVPAN